MTTITSAVDTRLPDDAVWRADPYTTALRAGRGPLFLRRLDGRLLPLDVERWCAAADAADRSVLARCAGPTLDIGCGPGRLVAALAVDGRPALGVDINPTAVARTIAAGGHALCRSIFAPIPGEGRWRTALLIDGNIGIGGDPRALLERIGRLADADGLALVETAQAEVDERLLVRVDDGSGRLSRLFPWARVGPAALRTHAAAAGWSVAEEWTADGRPFTALRRR